MKKIVYGIFSVLLVLSLSSCSLAGVPTEIESADFNDVQALLEEQYELSLPDTAVFIDGYFDNAFRDPSVIIVFTIEQPYFEQMLSENWIVAGYVDGPNDFLEDQSALESFSADKKYDFQGEQFTFLWCDDLENGSYTCVFVGHHPSKYF